MPADSSRSTFEKTIPKNKICLVKFYSPFCPACVNFNDRVPEIKERYPKIVWFDINTNDNPKLARDYGIHYIPTVFIYEKGKEVGKLEGATLETVLEKIKRYFK